LDKNGCIYCVDGAGISNYNRPELGIELHSGSKQLIAYGKDANKWGISLTININFCPMCGRNLRKIA
jgi:hypothetical protein